MSANRPESLLPHIGPDSRRRHDAPPDQSIGQLLLSAGKLTAPEIKRITVQQRKQGRLFGDVAVSLGLVSENDVRQALARQFEYPCDVAGSGLGPMLVAAHRPYSTQSEALRALRTQLGLRWFHDRSTRVLAVVAPKSDSGCSVLAANLAISFAQLGERTLLIDGNCRKPSQHRNFGLKQETGLSNMLAGRGSFEDAARTVPAFANLAVLAAGSVAPNPQELLGRPAFASLLDKVSADFDTVLIDTPPILEYADAQTIAARARACLLMARRHVTRTADLQRARELLVPTGSALLGAVVCN